MVPDVDFTVYKDKTQVKGFLFRNDDDTYYDFTGSSVRMDFFKTGPNGTPEVINGSTTLSTGSVAFTLLGTIFDTLGNFEYVVIETKSTNEEVPLTRGNVLVVNYVPFSESINAFLTSELPIGLVVNENFINQKIKYWRLFLQDAFDIKDANINNDDAWPILVNALIAKLIAYDTLIQVISGNIINVLGNNVVYKETSANTSAGIKSIETGPTKVEFKASGDLLTDIMKSASTRDSGFLNMLTANLCGLASKLGVKLPMCKQVKSTIIFKHYKNPEWEYPTLRDILTEEQVL